MTLAEFCDARGFTLTEAARQTGINQPTLHQHATGRRLPRPKFIEIYRQWSGGAVTAADFYGLADKGQAA